jgi:hypothetical protein
MEKIPGSHNGESSPRDSFGDDFPNPSDHGEVKTGSFVFFAHLQLDNPHSKLETPF